MNPSEQAFRAVAERWWAAVLVTEDGTSHGRADGSHSAWVGPDRKQLLAIALEAQREANEELKTNPQGRHPGGYYIVYGRVGPL